ncbi:hypothetical protein AB0467_26140 [Streptomyces sp. NPDC052095]|uniref:hypothetical protein n=1 Tax=unclassified Streptomyces TaxID=2593676 RepID=UPI00344FC577
MDYESIQDLHIRNSRTLEGIERCKSLEILTLVACDPVETGQLSQLASLTSLTVRDSGLISLSGLSKLSLLSCYTPRNIIQDIEPLLNISRLRNVDLTGNPLSEKSYRQIVPRLIEKDCRVILSEEFEWRLTRHLHDNGVPVSCYTNQGAYRLCRPGLKLTDSPEYAHPVISESDAASLLSGDPRRALEYFEDD